MKKALRIIGRVVTILILLFAICVMVFTIISVNTVDRDAGIFGYKPFIVLSDSMKDTFEVGDIAVSRSVEPDTLQPGDIVTFRSIDPNNFGEVVTHKIREVTTYEGAPAFVTYGTTTNVNDTYPVPFEQVMGQYAFRLPKMGYFFQFLKTPAGYVTLILIPFLLLIAIQAVKFIRLMRQYRSEQQAELDAQHAELQAEREETLKMKEELERLKAELTGSVSSAGAQPGDSGTASPADLGGSITSEAIPVPDREGSSNGGSEPVWHDDSTGSTPV